MDVAPGGQERPSSSSSSITGFLLGSGCLRLVDQPVSGPVEHQLEATLLERRKHVKHKIARRACLRTEKKEIKKEQFTFTLSVSSHLAGLVAGVVVVHRVWRNHELGPWNQMGGKLHARRGKITQRESARVPMNSYKSMSYLASW